MSLMLFDGNNLYYRAWFASQKGSMTANGVSTGPLVIFMSTLSNLVRRYGPTKVGVCWDGGKSKFRTQVRSEYKANRDHSDYSDAVYDGRLLIQTLLALCGVPQISREGYEADDLIAGFWSTAEEPVMIVSNDKDLTQLCGANPQGFLTQVARLSSADTGTDIWGAEEVEAHYGCSPRHLPLLMALMGDTSDNIEGIHGIGPKRALKILKESNFNTIETLNHDLVWEHATLVRSNLMLINLRLPLAGMDLRPIKPFNPTGPDHEDWPHLHKFLRQYQLNHMRSQLAEKSYWEPVATAFDQGQ